MDKVDDVDEVVPGGIPHAGPLECKVLLGSDGRDYLLEIMRLTPRDANYVKVKLVVQKLLHTKSTPGYN